MAAHNPMSILSGLLLSALVVGCHGLREKSAGSRSILASSSSYTVRVNTFKRQDCLKEVIFAWRNCHPAEIRVVWSEGEDQIPEWLHSLVQRGVVAMDVYPSTNLTNRFMPANFVTDAVFSVDDDVAYSCKTMEMAAAMFQKNPRSMVGFAPRIFTNESGDAWLSSWETGRANTLLPTKGAFMHKDMYTAFFADELKQFRDKIDTYITAEDILMAHLHASKFRIPIVPLALRTGDSQELQCGDKLTTGGDKGLERRALYDEISAYFGNVFEGLETDVIVLDTDREQYRPMNKMGTTLVDSALDTAPGGLDLCCEQHPSCCDVRDKHAKHKRS